MKEPVRDLNLGPLAPKVGIMPLDQQACHQVGFLVRQCHKKKYNTMQIYGYRLSGKRLSSGNHHSNGPTARFIRFSFSDMALFLFSKKKKIVF